MRITLLTWGTRGDVQPYVALGHALARRGHAIRVAANENHVAWVKRAGFEAISMPLDLSALLRTDAARQWLASGQTTTFLRWVGSVEHAQHTAIADALIAACDGADAIVSSYFPCHRAAAIAEKMNIALVRAFTFPIKATCTYGSPYLPTWVPKLPLASLRHASHGIALGVAERSARATLNALRARLGMGSQVGSAEAALWTKGIPTLHLFSEHILPRPEDWPRGHEVTGPCVLQDDVRRAVGEDTPTPELERWLAAGPPPLYFGFGSMPVLDPARLIDLILRICQKFRVRALVGAGWTEFAERQPSDDILIVGTFNHDALLPRCRAAVHHGGAGTTHASLRAGLPTLVCPVFGDQPLWGDRVAALGVGATFPFQRLSRSRLEPALELLLSEPVKARARSLGERLRVENGVEASANAIELALGATRAVA
jgi:sterol 3beta-glucosyltransferase